MEPALKQRLVGASVIIALAVIFIPMMFDDSNRSENQSISIDIPEEPSDLKNKIIAIDGQANDSSNNNDGEASENLLIQEQTPIIEKQETIIDLVDNSAKITKEEDNEEIPAEVKPVDVKPIVIKPIVTTSEPQPLAKEPTIQVQDITESDEKKYRVKFGVFSQQKNAQQLKAKIIHNGMDAIVEKDPATGMYKVYSKNYSIRSNAEIINGKISKFNLKLGKTSIEELNKEAIDDAELLLDTGWIVQIGIFSSKENSIKLRNKIRNKGFVCFVDEIMNSNNQNLYRVRIGPFAERDEADAAKTNIKKKMDLKGLIKPHEQQKVVF